MNSEDKICTVYFVRHGESSCNVSQTLLDKYGDKLTENGKMQAELLGKHLSDVRFDRVYSSTYARASDTAQIILKNTKPPQVEIQTDERLREIDYGIIVGKSYKDGLAFIKSVNLNLPVLEWKIPEGESFRESGERISRFWKEICSDVLAQGNSKVENILVVTHSIAMTNFFASLPETEELTIHNWCPEEDLKVMKNCTYMKVALTLNVKGGIEMNFISKHYSEHLNLEKSEDEETGIKHFVKKADSGKEFSRCVQQ